MPQVGVEFYLLRFRSALHFDLTEPLVPFIARLTAHPVKIPMIQFGLQVVARLLEIAPGNARFHQQLIARLHIEASKRAQIISSDRLSQWTHRFVALPSLPFGRGAIELDHKEKPRFVWLRTLGPSAPTALYKRTADLTVRHTLNPRIQHALTAQYAAQPHQQICLPRLIKRIPVKAHAGRGRQFHIHIVSIQVQLVIPRLNDLVIVREFRLPGLHPVTRIDPRRRHHQQPRRMPAVHVRHTIHMLILITIARLPSTAERLGPGRGIRTQIHHPERTAGRIEKEVARLRRLNPRIHIISRRFFCAKRQNSRK